MNNGTKKAICDYLNFNDYFKGIYTLGISKQNRGYEHCKLNEVILINNVKWNKEIICKQWLNTDDNSLITVIKSHFDLIKNPVSPLWKMTHQDIEGYICNTELLVSPRNIIHVKNEDSFTPVSKLSDEELGLVIVRGVFYEKKFTPFINNEFKIRGNFKTQHDYLMGIAIETLNNEILNFLKFNYGKESVF